MTTAIKLGVLEFELDQVRGSTLAAIRLDGRWIGSCSLSTAEVGTLHSLAAQHDNGTTVALQAQLDDVAEALGKERLEASDGYHGTAVRELAAQHAKGQEEIARLRAAAPVMITALAWIGDEADTKEMREMAVWYAAHHKDHLETWLDAHRSGARREPGDGYCPCGERLDKEHRHDR